jgi:hypothetical protein
MNAVLMHAILFCVGRAAALTGGGFVLGTILGAVIQNWLRVDIVPLGVSFAAWIVFRHDDCIQHWTCRGVAVQLPNVALSMRQIACCAERRNWHYAELQLAWRARGRAQHPGPVVRMHVRVLSQRDECGELRCL